MAGLSLSIKGAKVINNKVNLCDSCRFTIAECGAKFEDVMFGDGRGNDNVCSCRFYEAKGVELHCKDCEYYKPSTRRCVSPRGTLFGVDPDGFCSEGRRGNDNVYCRRR